MAGLSTRWSDWCTVLNACFEGESNSVRSRAPTTPNHSDFMRPTPEEPSRGKHLAWCTPGCILIICTDQLAVVFINIFNLSVLQGRPTLKGIYNVSAQEVTCLNDYWLVVLVAIMMKCLEMLVMTQINSCLSNDLVPLLFAQCCKQQRVRSHLLSTLRWTIWITGTRASGCSSAFKTFAPSKLAVCISGNLISTHATGSSSCLSADSSQYRLSSWAQGTSGLCSQSHAPLFLSLPTMTT